MKMLILSLSLLASFESYALTCTSEDNFAKKLVLQEVHGTHVKGDSYIRTTINLFVGTFKDNFLEKNYTLYNQTGQEFLFVLKKKIHFPNHCRARVCPPTVPAHFENMVGKLTTVDNEGETSEEYFSCF